MGFVTTTWWAVVTTVYWILHFIFLPSRPIWSATFWSYWTNWMHLPHEVSLLAIICSLVWWQFQTNFLVSSFKKYTECKNDWMTIPSFAHWVISDIWTEKKQQFLYNIKFNMSFCTSVFSGKFENFHLSQFVIFILTKRTASIGNFLFNTYFDFLATCKRFFYNFFIGKILFYLCFADDYIRERNFYFGTIFRNFRYEVSAILLEIFFFSVVVRVFLSIIIQVSKKFGLKVC